VFGPKPVNPAVPAAPIVLKGQALPVPKWQVNLGAQYDFDVGLPAYLRVDYQFTGKYKIGVPAGLPSYTPDNLWTESADQINVRAGATIRGWDANVFVNNLLNSQDIINPGIGVVGTVGGRGRCPTAEGAACTNYGYYGPIDSLQTLRPREIGVQVSRRF
jgi:hypothetical protein